MSRRRRNHSIAAGPAADPGKDLFAYLFLLMMVFVFVLLMTLHQVQSNATAAPQTSTPAGSTAVKSIDQHQLGRLIKKNGQLVLCFGEHKFRPQQDIKQLLSSAYLVDEQDKSGITHKTLYLDGAQQQSVLLCEYLTSFQALSQAGISVAFAEQVAK